jgi:5-methyltetrahydropteroyltriglutamate--homocysteine methyltransferase
MSARESPPFRADHVGSLLRPPELLRAREDFAEGRISFGRLRAVEDDAIREAVHRQEDLGLSAITDGELRRTSWQSDFIYQISGVGRAERSMQVTFHGPSGTAEYLSSAAAIDSKLAIYAPIFGDHFQFLAGEVRKGTPKLSIPSPNQLHLRAGRSLVDTRVYPDMEWFFSDLADAYAEEVRLLYALGCRYLQLDDTSLAYMNDPRQREEIARLGGNLERQHLVYLKTIGRVLSAKPADMAITVHLCRGNFRSSWVAEGGYDYVAEAMFDQLDVDGFFMEWDDERSGGFEPLRFLPKGKVVVLGLVTSKRGDLEGREQLERRIEEATRYVDIDQLCLSPQCGFSSTVEGNVLSNDQQWAKLELVVATAEAVWGSAR